MRKTREIELPSCKVVDAFPRVWLSGVMMPIHVGEICGDYEPAATATYAAMGFGWPAPRLQRMIADSSAGADRPESWKVPRGSWRMVMYRADATSAEPPLGVVAFQPYISVTPRTQRINELWLVIQLVWVAPAHRGKGYGKHLAAHLIHYLEQHPITGTGHEIARGGLTAIVNAEIHSGGGRRVVEYIYEFFELRREEAVLGRMGSHWRVKSAEFIDE